MTNYDEMFTADDGLTVAGRAQVRQLCERTICRLPSISEFEEWSTKLEAAQTDEQLLAVADKLAWLVGTYQQYRGINIVHNTTIFERLDEYAKHSK